MTQTPRVRIREFDIANYIQTPEDVAAYLKVVTEEHGDDPKQLASALRDILKAQGRMAEVAAKANIGRPSIYKALSENGNPSLETFVSILHGAGLRMRIEAAV